MMLAIGGGYSPPIISGLAGPFGIHRRKLLSNAGAAIAHDEDYVSPDAIFSTYFHIFAPTLRFHDDSSAMFRQSHIAGKCRHGAISLDIDITFGAIFSMITRRRRHLRYFARHARR